jgi:hypothetical protein
MPDLHTRLAALESFFGTVNLGDWSNDQDVPIWIAMRIRTELVASLTSAVHLVAQIKLAGGKAEGGGQLVAEIVDDICGTRVPGRPPRPHWGAAVAELGQLADRYPHGSALRDAAFDLSRRIVDRAQALGR